MIFGGWIKRCDDHEKKYNDWLRRLQCQENKIIRKDTEGRRTSD